MYNIPDMKKFLSVIIAIFLISTCNVFGEGVKNEPDAEVSEIMLEFDATPIQEISIEEATEIREKTLAEKIEDIKKAECYDYEQKNFLLKEILTHKFPAESKLDYTEIWGGYNGDIGLRFRDDGQLTNHYDVNALNIGIDGYFKDNNADFRFLLGFMPRSHRNFVSTMFSDMYVATNKVPHHRFVLGYTRPPVGKEGGNSAYTLPFFSRAQIARNFGNARHVGIRAIGDYSFIDYDIGAYSTDTYFREFLPGAEFIGWVNFKPLAKTDGKYGKLKIGAGMDAGHRNGDYLVTGVYVGYEYKKFMANFEWSNANGYNGSLGYDPNKHASGFYATLGYMLTKKLQLLVRYDQFNPDHAIKHNNKREYSVGLNYFIKGQALRLILNYVFCQNDAERNSHRIILGTQIML